mgnify:CR=1 FL=1
MGHCIECASWLFSWKVAIMFVCLFLLGLKVTPKSHTPFDSRMPQNSPMTIYDAQKKFSPAAGFRPKDNNAHMHNLFLYLDPTPFGALTLFQRTATSNFTL